MDESSVGRMGRPEGGAGAPPSSEGQVRVRALERRDAEGLARLAAELNAHQGDPTEHFTAEAVLRDGFGPEPAFRALVAEADGELLGYALLVPAYETAWAASGYYLSDLHVTESARRRGVGRALVAAAAAEARRQGKSYLWWATRAWNDEAQAFYRRLGAFDEALHAHVLPQMAFEELARHGERLLGEGAA